MSGLLPGSRPKSPGRRTSILGGVKLPQLNLRKPPMEGEPVLVEAKGETSGQMDPAITAPNEPLSHNHEALCNNSTTPVPETPKNLQAPLNIMAAVPEVLSDTDTNRSKSKHPKNTRDSRHINQQDIVEDMKTKFTASKNAPLWDQYVKISDAEDKDILEDWEGAIDVTLVFAALFSAISTGFVLESSKNLKPDQGVTTVLAIRELTSIIQTGFDLPVGSLSSQELATLNGSFQPSTIAVWVNCLWFLSLGLSISVSLFAMLAKRWCYRSRSRHSGTAYERAMRRQEAWDTLQKWKLELLIEQLPTVMHVALMSFFIGLVLYLSEIHQATMIITAVPIGFTISSYGALTVFPAWSPTFPMVTPFTRIMQAASWYLSKLFKYLRSKFESHVPHVSITYKGIASFLTKTTNTAAGAIKRSIGLRSPDIQENAVEAQSPPSSELSESTQRWAITGNTQPIGRTLDYPGSKEHRYAFRALLWLLENCNDKALISSVLEYIGSFPEVVLESCASSQELLEATIVIVEHFQRLKHDAIDWHELNDTHFSAKCGRFIYLVGRPWLHYSASASHRKQDHIWEIYDHMISHNPDMSTEEVDDQLKVIKEKDFSGAGCILWLEQQAVRIVLGCPPETGFRLCKALYQTIAADKRIRIGETLSEEIHSALAWMFLNTTMDAYGSADSTFWPNSVWDQAEDSYESQPIAEGDSTLTLSYFRHSETRKENSSWLVVMGFAGMIYSYTHYPSHDDGPVNPSNRDYFEGLLTHLRHTLDRLDVLQGTFSCIGQLPVHWRGQVRLYEFDSIEYCRDVLISASDNPIYAEFREQIVSLLDVIRTSRAPKPNSEHTRSDIDSEALSRHNREDIV